MKYLKYGVNYVINYHIRKKSPPLIAGLAVTCKCNLRCRHCRVTNRGVENTRYEEIIDVIDTFYNKAQLEEFCEYINKISQIHGIFCLLNSRAGIISALKNNWKRPLCLAKQYRHIIDSGEVKNRSDLALKLGISKVHVCCVLSLLKLNDDLIDSVERIGNPMPTRIVTERMFRVTIFESFRFMVLGTSI
jgi:hypothetical protein